MDSDIDPELREQRQILEDIVKLLERLLSLVLDSNSLQRFDELLAPISNALQSSGINITVDTGFAETGDEHSPASQATQSSPQRPDEDNIPKRAMGKHTLPRTRNIATHAHIPKNPGPRGSSGSRSNIRINLPIIESRRRETPTNISQRFRERPVLARLAIRILRYEEKPPLFKAASSKTGTSFQNEVESALNTEYALHGASVEKLTRLRRLESLYFTELEFLQQRNPKLNQRQAKAKLVTSLQIKFKRDRKTIVRLLTDIEVLSTILKIYSENNEAMVDTVLLAIAIEYYGTSAKYTQERMDTMKYYLPWLASLASTDVALPPGFRVPEGSLFDSNIQLVTPLEPLDLQPMEVRSDLWTHVKEKYLVICGDKLVTMIRLDAKTVIGNMSSRNKLGVMQRASARNGGGNCISVGNTIVADIEIKEMSELILTSNSA
ncbi:hypothetical protein TWF706_009797 [Orbilia oligospora]|nr:hypothetical protein TWF706_009797 [Orbilia oligospora]